MAQDGNYVDIPGGSQCYIYGNGRDINGWSEAEFAALIGEVAHLVSIDGDTAYNIEHHFSKHFGGWDETYEGSIPAPERGEIFCQCIDRRIEGVELTDEIQHAVQEWVESHNVLTECDYCGEEFRPYLDSADCCTDEECEIKEEADMYNVEPRIIKNSKQLFSELHYSKGWPLSAASDEASDYLFEQSPRDFE